MKNEMPSCARCSFNREDRICRKEDGKSPSFCPTVNKTAVVAKALSKLQNPEVFEFAKQASIQEGEGYGDKALGYSQVKPVKPRIMEIIEFSK